MCAFAFIPDFNRAVDPNLFDGPMALFEIAAGLWLMFMGLKTAIEGCVWFHLAPVAMLRCRSVPESGRWQPSASGRLLSLALGAPWGRIRYSLPTWTN